ncbi:MAG: FHA domain-containing protein [Candidatus Competibacteraceae bacterium]|nr:MAG: FHA domain-containing protein [Candidatus Competibacteraceae bacterium]
MFQQGEPADAAPGAAPDAANGVVGGTDAAERSPGGPAAPTTTVLVLAEKRRGRFTGARWTLTARTTIGADSGPDRAVLDLGGRGREGKSVSRRHAELRPVNDGWVLEDVGTEGRGSTYGTCRNGRRLRPRTPEAVRVGDTLSFGLVMVLVLVRGRETAAGDSGAGRGRQ